MYSKYTFFKQCTGFSKSGKPCKNNAMQNHDKCHSCLSFDLQLLESQKRAEEERQFNENMAFLENANYQIIKNTKDVLSAPIKFFNSIRVNLRKEDLKYVINRSDGSKESILKSNILTLRERLISACNGDIALIGLAELIIAALIEQTDIYYFNMMQYEELERIQKIDRLKMNTIPPPEDSVHVGLNQNMKQYRMIEAPPDTGEKQSELTILIDELEDMGLE